MTAVPSDGGMGALLEALPEPSFVLDTMTRVLMANRAASACFGPLVKRELTELAPVGAAAELRRYLIRCSGSRGALPGTAMLRDANGQEVRFRCHGSLIAPACAGHPACVLLRLAEAADERFSALARDVRRLNAEIRERRRMQAVLEEALRDREVMLRELHHRVKNNIQVLLGMITAAQREAAVPEAQRILAEIAGRIDAIGAVHQMLYRADTIESLDGARFATDLSAAILRPYGAESRLASCGTAGARLPTDAVTPLALILNELLVNAVKHGGRDGEIRVELSSADNAFVLSVEDDGPGFDPARPTNRASGLGLVRGLARQLGGSFAVECGQRGGARCVVRFSADNGGAAIQSAA